MNNGEKNCVDSKQKIRDRGKGVDQSELTIIPAKVSSFEGSNGDRRTAAYVRVSTYADAQTLSFELQKNYYADYIRNQPGWVMVDTYADEGISGTQIKRREGLKKLLADCRAGKIDYIITKSISRFARNTAECLSMIDELKNLKPPVGIIFENENIDTLSGASGLVLSIYAALAEGESQNKSDAMNWSIETRFAKGIFLTPELIGFDKDEDGKLIKNPDEALTVKLCFYLFLAGFSTSTIAEILTELERKTGYNKLHNKKPGVVPEFNTVWTSSTVVSVLRNERHCGDILARKTFTPNFKTHKARKNRGERTQVIKHGDHEEIVSREVFEAVNNKLDHMMGKKDRPHPIMKVIDGGVLTGYVPVDRTWRGFSEEDYMTASQSAYDEGNATTTVEEITPSITEADNKTSSRLAGFKVASAQLFNTKTYPAVTISNSKIRFNSACLKKFEDVEYVELLFNPVKKCIAVRPCDENNPNAIRWGKLCDGKWTVMEKSCKGFAKPLFNIMNWDEDIRYRMRGGFQSEGDNRLMVFDLEDTEKEARVPIEDIPTEPEVLEEPSESSVDISNEVGDLHSEEKPQKTKYKIVSTYDSHNQFGRTVLEEQRYLERFHYAGDWEVLRPAREVVGISPVSEDEIVNLLHEATEIIETLRKTG